MGHRDRQPTLPAARHAGSSTSKAAGLHGHLGQPVSHVHRGGIEGREGTRLCYVSRTPFHRVSSAWSLQRDAGTDRASSRGCHYSHLRQQAPCCFPEFALAQGRGQGERQSAASNRFDDQHSCLSGFDNAHRRSKLGIDPPERFESDGSHPQSTAWPSSAAAFGAMDPGRDIRTLGLACRHARYDFARRYAFGPNEDAHVPFHSHVLYLVPARRTW